MDLSNPIFWGVMIAWIMSVVLHEFAHGIVAYWGGDYTIKERGGLTLNPLKYVDPVFSLLLPAIFLLMGGIPLPGGVTYVRRDLLRSRVWSTAVAAAGPAMNLMLFFACLIPFHPKLRWIDAPPIDRADGLQVLLGTMVILQFLTVLLNLVPIPPLDGFQMVSPYLDERSRVKLSTPPVSTILFVGFFLLLWQDPQIIAAVLNGVLVPLLEHLGYNFRQINFFRRAYIVAFS